MSRDRNCVFVWEIAILAAKGNRIVKWEIWESHNCYRDAAAALRQARNSRSTWRSKLWVSLRFFRATNRIRKYVPELRGN